MVVQFVKETPLASLLSGLAIWTALSGPAMGQAPSVQQASWWPRRQPMQVCPPSPCPPVTPSMPPAPAQPMTPQPAPIGQQPGTTQPAPAQPSTTPPAPTPPAAPPAAAPSVEAPEAPPEGAAAATLGGSESFAPNMIGHLLYGSRSVLFHYQRSAGSVNVLTNGATSIINPAVADNNSPIPRDRVYYRYNFFQAANSVTGIGSATTLVNGVASALPVTKNYDLNLHNFGFEKTFFDRLFSLEMRMPFSTGLSPRNVFSAGDITGPAPGQDANGNPLFTVAPTPFNTLGSEATVWGNMTLILKGLAAYSEDRAAFSGGLAMTFPTGPDTNITVVDYSSTAASLVASGQRVRNFHINNSTVGLSPFVSALVTPTDRLFAQGFMQVDIPLNSSHITYNDVFTRGAFGVDPARVAAGTDLATPFSVGRDIVEQPLLQVDLGTGYWLLRNPQATWLNGIAPIIELHYTTTLRNANIVTLPGDGSIQADPTRPGVGVAEARPQVGNQRNRMDILDLTAGTTLLLANRATVTTAFAVPLRGDDNRTFNWEFLLQLNYYFGAAQTQPRFAPNF